MPAWTPEWGLQVETGRERRGAGHCGGDGVARAGSEAKGTVQGRGLGLIVSRRRGWGTRRWELGGVEQSFDRHVFHAQGRQRRMNTPDNSRRIESTMETEGVGVAREISSLPPTKFTPPTTTHYPLPTTHHQLPLCSLLLDLFTLTRALTPARPPQEAARLVPDQEAASPATYLPSPLRGGGGG